MLNINIIENLVDAYASWKQDVYATPARATYGSREHRRMRRSFLAQQRQEEIEAEMANLLADGDAALAAEILAGRRFWNVIAAMRRGDVAAALAAYREELEE